jgi:PiT family inorganic phosphate transporter
LDTGLLILTCTLVSSFHGSNDGQKGMGLIMLILIGVAPTAYALNRALPDSHTAEFVSASDAASKVVATHSGGFQVLADPRPVVTEYIHDHKISGGTYPSIEALMHDVEDQVQQYGTVSRTPFDKVQNIRNDMYLTSEALRVLGKDKESDLQPDETKAIKAYKKDLDDSTKFTRPGSRSSSRSRSA